MKKLFFLLGLVFCLSCISKIYVPNPGPSSPPADLNFTLVTYNIKIGLKDLNNVKQNLKLIDADIVCLQEVHGPAVPNNSFGQIDQAQFLANELGMNYVFGKAQNWASGEYGVAILSKYPILEQEETLLPTEMGEEQEVLLRAKIQHPKKDIWVFTTHLIANTKNSANNAGDLRLEQAKVVKQQALNAPEDVVIVAGDFNAYGFSKTKREMNDGFVDVFDEVGQGYGATFPDYFPFLRLDYIYTRGFVLDATDSKVFRVEGSDHFPLWARFTINPNFLDRP